MKKKKLLPKNQFLSLQQRDQQRKKNPSGRTEERWSLQGPHPEGAIQSPDQDLETGAATLCTPRLVTWVHQEVMEVQVPTKTLNSPSSTRLLSLLILLFFFACLFWVFFFFYYLFAHVTNWCSAKTEIHHGSNNVMDREINEVQF